MLIINANIKTMENVDYENGFIYVKEGKIADLGDMSNLNIENISDDITIDAKNALVLPGFIDPHCHIGMCEDSLGFEGDDVNEETDPITPHLRAIDAVNSFDRCFKEAIFAGVTTVLTGPGSSNPIAGEWLAMKTFGSRIDDMIIASPIGMKFALGENPKVSYYDIKSQAPQTRMATAALIREQLTKAIKYKEQLEKSSIDEEEDEPEYDIKCEALLPLLKGEVKAFFHAHRADDIFTALRITKEFNLRCVIVHATEGHKISDILKRENVPVLLGPILCDRSKPELREQTAKNPALLHEAGVSLALCTDHPETPIQYLALSAAVACREGLPYLEALKSITINGAKIVGIDNRVGSLKIGKDADFCLFDGDPLLAMAVPSCVIINGEIVKSQNNKLL